ncbi:hypothetical protein [Spiroplasma endosymbiont of Cantharis lateralis]|uniref:hypothetical protein n=1 Tax=Spiroplasma endosymbiont of Cantharis lateralis TaxID=3066277 RepID=UPI00313D8A22
MIAQDLSEFPESIKGLEEMIDNFKEIRSWWLKGREVTAFSEQFNYSETELELESRDSDEAIKLGLELSKNKDINESNINFRGWGNNAGGSGEHFALASNETDKYIGYAIFNCFIK